jgi:hypothetical protein
MNKELAEMYGNETESVEKLAAAELAEKLSDEGGLDLTGLTEEQLEELAKSVMSSGEEKVAEEDAEEVEEEAEETEEAETPAEETAEEPEKTAEADELTDEDKQKLAEADYLGRVMAHAFVAEKRDIEKSAAAKEKTAGKVSDALKNLAGKAKGVASKKGAQVGAAGAGGAAAGFAAGRLSKKEKKGSGTPNLDALADARVKEILEANGIKEEPVAEPETPVEAEKTAEPSPEEKQMALANAVEARAVEKLKSLGYEISAEEPKAEETPAQE